MRRVVTTSIVAGMLLVVPRALSAEQAKAPVPEPNMTRMLPSRDAAPRRLRFVQIWHQCSENSHCGVGFHCCFYSSGNRCRPNNQRC